jgi:hypothetical protein
MPLQPEARLRAAHKRTHMPGPDFAAHADQFECSQIVSAFQQAACARDQLCNVHFANSGSIG